MGSRRRRDGTTASYLTVMQPWPLLLWTLAASALSQVGRQENLVGIAAGETLEVLACTM